jgi:hypothetical protein
MTEPNEHELEVVSFHNQLQHAFPNSHIEWHKSTDNHVYHYCVDFKPIQNAIKTIKNNIKTAKTIHIIYDDNYIYYNSEA